MNYNKKKLSDIDCTNKKIILRLDLNVPLRDGKITDDKRIREVLPVLEYLISKNCKIVILSHLSRIKKLEDKENGKKSLRPVYEDLKNKIKDVEINFFENNTDPNLKKIVNDMKPGSVLVLENTRYNDVENDGKVTKKESKNDPALGKFWASLGEIFVNDAFGTVHREHASNVGIAKNIKDSCIGFLIEKEIEMLSKVIDSPQEPFVAIFGGAKISDKIKSIDNIAKIASYILIGGGMTYTFLKAKGYSVGSSLVEEDSIEIAKNLLEKYSSKIILPVDSNCAKSFVNEKAKHFGLNIPDEYMGLDIGKKTIKLFSSYIKNAKTIVWNGPVGVFEFSNFMKGTKSICKAMGKACLKNDATCIIGGGDSAAAAIKLGYENSFTHISTGGGASLTFFENSPLPGIDSIKNNI